MEWYPKTAKNEHKRGNKKVPNFGTFLVGAPGRIRTCDLPVRSRALYPLSYKRMHFLTCFVILVLPVQNVKPLFSYIRKR